jgi:hypothetical protein
MAIGRVSGEMLLPNLERDGVDLAVETDLLYFDVTNQRIGIRTALTKATFNATLSGTTLTVTPSTPGTGLTGGTISAGMLVKPYGPPPYTSNYINGTRIVSGSGTSWIINKNYTAALSSLFTAEVEPDFNFVINTDTRILDTTESESCETGALVVDGGVGIGKNLNVCGDIFIKGQKVNPNAGGAKRKIYSFNIPALAVGAVYTHTATLGYSNIMYNLTVTAPVKVEVHSTPALDDDNPYTFLATTLHQTDDGTVYFTDGTRMRTRQYSILANLETPPTKNIYFKITGIGDVFGGTPLSNLTPATFLGTIIGTTLTVVGAVTGRMVKGMTVTSTTAGLVAPNTVLTEFIGSTWQINVNYYSGIGSATAPVVMNAQYQIIPNPIISVSFYGYITGNTLVVTKGLSTTLVPGMKIISTDPTVTIFSNTVINAAVGSVWKVSQTNSVGTMAPEVLQSRVLVNTLEMIYIDEISDSGTMSANVVAVLPLTGYVGETVFRTTDQTYWVYASGSWNQIH